MNNLPGGLFVKKKRPQNLQQQPSTSSSSSNPMASRLGLDRLAAEKAAERAAAAEAAPLMAPPPKRPILSHLRDDDDGGDAHPQKKYRRPREETPSHPGGVNVEAAERIKERVAERLKGAGQQFTTTKKSSDAGASSNPPNTAGTATTRGWMAASPALSSGGSEWEAPSPMHPPPLVPDRAQFGSEPRGFLADTPLDTPQNRTGSLRPVGDGSSAPSRDLAGGATPQLPAALSKDSRGGTYQLGSVGSSGPSGSGGGADEWERGSVAGGDDEQAGAAEADDKLDRDWYDAEEGGRMVDETHVPFLGDQALFDKREEQLKKRVNHRREARLRDADRWEEGRLRASGMVTMLAADDDDDDQELRTQVVVHDIKPPFLDGRTVYSKQSEPVMPVKDPTSDMAVFSKKGSQLMRDVRERCAAQIIRHPWPARTLQMRTRTARTAAEPIHAPYTNQQPLLVVLWPPSDACFHLGATTAPI